MIALFLLLWLNLDTAFTQDKSIKTIKIYQLPISTTNFTQKLEEKQQFNPKGQLISKKVYTPTGWQSYHYTYNKQQFIASISLMDEQGNLLLEWLYQYDDKGNKVAESYWIANQYVICKYFYYNEYKQLTKTQTYWDEQLDRQQTDYHYQQQQLQNITQYNIQQDVQKSIHYKYDQKSRPYLLSYFNSEGILIQKERRVYNSSDQLVSTLWLDKKGQPTYRQVNMYYKEAEKVAETSYIPIHHNWRQVYQKLFFYNDQGLLTEIKQYDTNRQLVAHWKYRYDFY